MACSRNLRALINSGKYEEVIKFGDGMGREEFLKHLYQVVTNLDQFKSLFGYLRQKGMIPGFLAHGKMALVRKVIVGTDLLETDDFLGYCDSISDAIALSLEEDRHERVAGLFEAAQERPKWKNKFGRFVEGFFRRYPLEKNSMPLKRFLTLHGEEFSKKHPAIFKTICEELVWKLRCQPDNPSLAEATDRLGRATLSVNTSCIC